MNLKKWLQTEIKEVFLSLGYDPLLGDVKRSDRPDLADYQCNGALAIAKMLKKNPRDVATHIVAALSSLQEKGVRFSVDGPGFINMRLSDSLLKSSWEEILRKGFRETCAAQKPLNVIIDFAGPNAAKPMHIGHLRSSIIGESLKRLLRFVGHQVLGDIHLGDWGTQMGMLIHGLYEENPDWIYFNKNFEGPYPAVSPVTLEKLEALYPLISARAKEDEDLAQKCRLATAELQKGRPGYKALWQHFVDVSVRDMKLHFEKLGVSFDQWFGESRYEEQLAPLVEKFLKKGIAQKNEGAVIVPVKEEGDKIDMPPLLLQKSDGGFLYATTDVATLEERVHVFHANWIIYVVDARQDLHFTQVFRASRKDGIEAHTTFVGFGTMNGDDGKPFKTREGGVMKLGDLIEMLIHEAKKRLQEAGLSEKFTVSELDAIAEQVGIGALKFADLQHDPRQNYKFDLDKFMRFEGKTGPYLQYAGVRIKSILKKAADEKHPIGGLPQMLHEEERKLLLLLHQTSEAVAHAAIVLAPHVLADHAFEIAQQFSRFYSACPILTGEEDLRAGRLSLCQMTLNILEDLLALIGITIPERM